MKSWIRQVYSLKGAHVIITIKSKNELLGRFAQRFIIETICYALNKIRIIVGHVQHFYNGAVVLISAYHFHLFFNSLVIKITFFSSFLFILKLANKVS